MPAEQSRAAARAATHVEQLSKDEARPIRGIILPAAEKEKLARLLDGERGQGVQHGPVFDERLHHLRAQRGDARFGTVVLLSRTPRGRVSEITALLNTQQHAAPPRT